MKSILIFMVLICHFAYAGDRLLATGGVTQMEGAGGGGLVPWALISGYATQDQFGGAVFYTEAKTKDDFHLSSGGVSVGVYNRFEFSLSQQKFDLGNTVPGESIRVNTLGMKVRVLGDGIYDQDQYLPQISVGLNVKHNEDFDFVPQAVGAKHATGVDAYIAASKLYLGGLFGYNVLVNGALIATKANQFGILGFGGDDNDRYHLKPAVSVGVMLRDNLLLGAEYRDKPDNLNAFKETSAHDIFLAWFPHKNIGLTAAYVDLGTIADKDNQTGWYFSGQLSY